MAARRRRERVPQLPEPTEATPEPTEDAPDVTRPRLCRTPEEAYQAGLEDAKNDPPLTQAQIDYIARLWRPYIRRIDAA